MSQLTTHEFKKSPATKVVVLSDIDGMLFLPNGQYNINYMLALHYLAYPTMLFTQRTKYIQGLNMQRVLQTLNGVYNLDEQAMRQIDPTINGVLAALRKNGVKIDGVSTSIDRCFMDAKDVCTYYQQSRLDVFEAEAWQFNLDKFAVGMRGAPQEEVKKLEPRRQDLYTAAVDEMSSVVAARIKCAASAEEKAKLTAAQDELKKIVKAQPFNFEAMAGIDAIIYPQGKTEQYRDIHNRLARSSQPLPIRLVYSDDSRDNRSEISRDTADAPLYAPIIIDPFKQDEDEKKENIPLSPEEYMFEFTFADADPGLRNIARELLVQICSAMDVYFKAKEKNSKKGVNPEKKAKMLELLACVFKGDITGMLAKIAESKYLGRPIHIGSTAFYDSLVSIQEKLEQLTMLARQAINLQNALAIARDFIYLHRGVAKEVVTCLSSAISKYDVLRSGGKLSDTQLRAVKVAVTELRKTFVKPSVSVKKEEAKKEEEVKDEKKVVAVASVASDDETEAGLVKIEQILAAQEQARAAVVAESSAAVVVASSSAAVVSGSAAAAVVASSSAAASFGVSESSGVMPSLPQHEHKHV